MSVYDVVTANRLSISTLLSLVVTKVDVARDTAKTDDERDKWSAVAGHLDYAVKRIAAA